MTDAASGNAEEAPAGAVNMQEGLFRVDADGSARLLASRCPACQRIDFPRRRYCARCGEATPGELALDGEGKVVAYSVIDRRSKLVVIDTPYIQAEVAMPEGVHVFTVLRGAAPAEVRTGMEVRCHVESVSRDEQGRDVMTYVFRPIGAPAGEQHA